MVPTPTCTRTTKSIAVNGIAEGTVNEDFQVDVYGVYYNWLSIKDGRGMLSFA